MSMEARKQQVFSRRYEAVLLALFIWLATLVAAEAAPASVTTYPIQLTRTAPSCTIPWDSDTSGEVVLRLTAQAPGTNWGSSGKEAAVLQVAVDGGQPYDIVLYMGETSFTYPVALGTAGSGPHQLQVTFAQTKSAAGAETVMVLATQFAVVPPSSAQYAVLAHAPVLYGRNENNRSDVPLVMYYQDQQLSGGQRRIVYSVIWSNEDGGTNTLGLISTWGRTTDIEWIYDITLSSSGEIVREIYQGPNHAQTTFSGRRVGQHPVLRTATTNNNVVDTGNSRLCFGLYPAQALPAGATREIMMDQNPWTYQVAAAELAREGKKRQGLESGTIGLWKLTLQQMVADARNYVYVDFTAKLSAGYIGFAVKRRNDPTWYGWHPSYGLAGINRSGVNRVALEVPEGTTLTDLEALRVYTRPASYGNDFTVTLSEIRQVFMLDNAYVPQSSVAAWHGSIVFNTEHDSETVLRFPEN